MSEGTITCLRCRHCRLLPETDMSHPSPAVYCERKAEPGPLIVSGCGLADPRWRAFGGDKCRNVTPVERAWLRTNYPRLSAERLRRATGRNMNTMRRAVRDLNTPERERSHESRRQSGYRSAETRRRQGRCLTPEQSAYVVERHARGDWPTRGGNMRPDGMAARRSLIEEIVAEVAKRGPAHGWKTIVYHVHLQSPAAQRKKKQR